MQWIYAIDVSMCVSTAVSYVTTQARVLRLLIMPSSAVDKKCTSNETRLSLNDKVRQEECNKKCRNKM